MPKMVFTMRTAPQRETPQGIKDGQNRVFMTSFPAEEIQLFRNGLHKRLNEDFRYEGRNVVFNVAPEPVDDIEVFLW